MKYGHLMRLCKRYDVISFDIFDTLLKRDVLHPADVFELVELSLANAGAKQYAGFAKRRKEAEGRAREKSRYDEVTFDEIYRELPYSDEDKLVLKRAELKAERAVLRANWKMKKVFGACLKWGKRVYLVSDMYLPRDFLEGVLQSAGYSGYDGLYLSCEYRQTKRSGKLFQTLCKKEGIRPERVLHIGDSRYADCIGPARSGMRFAHVKRMDKDTIYYDVPKDSDSIDSKCLFAFLSNREGRIKSREERVGYEVLGPVIYGYCQWLHENIDGRDAKAWFAARDMYLFVKAYRMMYGKGGDVSYVYLSRKSLRPAYARAAGSLAKSGDAFARGKYSIRQIITYMGYSLDDANLDGDVDVDAQAYDARRLSESEEIGRILNSPAIKKEEERLCENALSYLRGQGLFDNDVLLADVGWHGTTQHLLSVIQKKETCRHHIEGYYIGCLDSTNEKIGRDAYHSFIFDESSDCMFMNGSILLECMILAPHGTTLRYGEEGGDAKPVLESGEEVPKIVLAIQSGAMRFVRDMCGSGLGDVIRLQPETAAKAFEKLAGEPLKEELEAIGELDFENFYSSKMASPQGLWHYILHAGDFFHDFKYSPWRIGFLYRLFKVRLPYARIYTAIRRMGGRIT